MGLNDNINKNTRAQKEFNAAAREGANIYEEYTDIFESIAGELGKTVSNAKRAKKEYNSLVSISKQLSNNQEEITKLNDKQLSSLKEQAAESVAEIGRITKKLKDQKELTTEEEALMAARESNLQLEKDLVTFIEEEIKIREKSNEMLGVAGGLLKGLNEIAGPFAKALKLDQVQKDMEKVADEAARTGDELGKIKVLGAGISGAFSSLVNTITDPSVILGAVVKSFGELGKAQKEFRQQTGQNADVFDGLNLSATSLVDLIGAATGLSKELGVNAAVVFSPQTIQEVAELTENMGLGAHEAAQLAKFAKLSGKELDVVTDNMEASFKAFVKTNKTGINIKDVMNDVGSASAAVTLSLGSQPEKIQQAAMEARKLGLSLEQVDKIAGSLLDFESSIQAEMEAEMLTGKELNLDKARQLALANDLEGVAKEIGKNEGILKAFSSGNRIAQEATAKAMGMSREEMAKMIYQQKLQNNLSTEQAAKAAGISLDEAKRLTTQEQISKALEKMAVTAASILDIFAPILSNSVVLATVMGSIGLIMTTKVLKSLKGSVGEMKSLVKGSLALLKNSKLTEALMGKFYKGGQFMKGGGRAKAGGQRGKGLLSGILGGDDKPPVGDKVKGKIDKIPDAPKSPEAGIGKKLKEFLTGLASGLKNMGKPGVIKGALATLLAAPGIIALGLASPALAVLAMIPGPALQASLTGLGKGLSALGTALMGPQLLGIALGLGILTVSMIGIGAALGLAAPGIEAFGTVINSIFTGVATVVTAVADGFVKLMEAVSMENILPLLLLGPALFGIAGGLASMAVAGLGALPIIGALGALALVASPLATLAGVFGGGGGGGDGDGEDPIIKKLDELIDIVSKGGDVIMDGNKVGRTLTLASSQIG